MAIRLSMLPRLRPADALYSRFSIANYGHSDGYNRVLADASVRFHRPLTIEAPYALTEDKFD
jgi:hypothetical protein